MSRWRNYVIKGWGSIYLVIAISTIAIEYNEQDAETLISIVIFQLLGTCIIGLATYAIGVMAEYIFRVRVKSNEQ